MQRLWSMVSTAKSIMTGSVEDGLGVANLRGHWGHVVSYFQQVQKTNDEPGLRKLRERLPEVEAALNSILSQLLAERQSFVVSFETHAGDLPPCYEFILRGSASSGISGKEILLHVCQYAKHDQPMGTRAIMLRFLTRFFAEVDVSEGHRSILHESPDDIARPLFDAIRKVGAAIGPLHAPSSALAVSAAGPPPPPATLEKTSSFAATTGAMAKLLFKKGADHERDRLAQEALENDRCEFVALLHALAQKVEAMPTTAAFFVSDLPYAPHHQLPHAVAAASGAQQRPTTSSFLLLDALVPFLKDSVTLLPAERRERCLVLALEGVLSLVRCSADGVRSFVCADQRAAKLAAAELCSYMLTVCKVPNAHETRMYMRLVLEYTRFFDEILLVAPAVAEAWDVYIGHLRDAFLQNTVLQLLQSQDERVFTATSFMLTQIIRTVTSTPGVQLLGEAIVGPALAAPGAAKLGIDRLLPRMRDISQTVVASTLQLFRAVVERMPEFAMRYLLRLDAVATPLVVHSRRFSLPAIRVAQYFPSRLAMTSGLCGTPIHNFIDEVLSRMLLIESMMTFEDLAPHTPRVDPSVAPPPADASENLLFCKDINDAPFVVAACERMEACLDQRFEVLAELTGVLTSLCLLPDLRVPFTLLDPQRGRFALALMKVRDSVDAAFEKEAGQPLSRTSKMSLYTWYAQRPFFESSDQRDVGDEQLVAALRNCRTFIEGCVCLEGLRHELEAAVSYIEVSRRVAEMTGNSVASVSPEVTTPREASANA